MYEPNDPMENLRQTRAVATALRAGGMAGYDANSLAILGGLPRTDGQALRLAAQSPGQSFDPLRQLALGTAGQRIVGTLLTVEEAFARLAALGCEPSPQPVAFHCPEDGCHGRAQLMIEHLQQLGANPSQIRRVWAFSMTSRLPTEKPGQWCFKIVETLDDREPELKARFIGDAWPLPINCTSERWWAVQVLSMSRRQGYPIAVLFGEDNRILDLGIIDREEVREVGENPHYPHVTDVQFEGMALPKHLSKQASRYEEMLSQVTEAATRRAFVWYVLKGSTIVDIKVLSHEEDDLLCRWVREHGQRAESVRLEKRCST